MVYLLAAVVVLLLGGAFCLLHGRIHRFGFGPLFLLIGALEIAMYSHSRHPMLAMAIPIPAVSILIFPVLLTGFFFVYAVDGTDRARVLFGAIVLVTVGYQLFVAFTEWSTRAGLTTGEIPIGEASDIRIAVASLVALAVDAAILTTAGQRFAQRLPAASFPFSLFVVSSVTLTVDALVYPVLAYASSPSLADLVSGHLLGKLAAAALLTIPFAIYFRRAGLVVLPRATFDFFVPPWDTVSRGLANDLVPRVPIESLYWSAASFGRRIDLRATLDQIVQESIRVVGVDQAWVFLRDPAVPSILVTRAGPAPGKSDEIRLPADGPSLAARVFRDGKTIDVPDAARDSRVDRRLTERFGTRSVLAVPLAFESEAIGSLVLVETRRRRRFSAHDIALARTLADYAAGAIANAQTFREISSLNEALALREQRLEQITSQMPAVFWVGDRDLVFSHSSGAGLSALGLRAGQVVGMKISDYLASGDRESVIMEAHRRALRGESSSREVSLFGRTFHISVEPFRDSAGAIVGVLGLALDVTERSRAEEALRESRAELATYHDLLTHDLANFSTTILGIVERLLSLADGPLTPMQEELLQRLNRQVWELNRLGENARLLARLRESGLPQAPERESLRQLLDRVETTLRAVHFDRAFVFETVGLDAEEAPDIPLFENVMMNLVDNAIRHSRPNATPSIRVSVGRPMDDEVSIAVRGGRPPDPKVLPQLFRRYVRGAHSGGSGLGLALVKEIVERSGGSVEAGIAESPDGGIFEVTLHLSRGEHAWRES